MEKAEIIKQEVAPVVAQANSVIVSNAAQYTVAAEFLKAIKAAQKMVKDHFGPMKKAAHAAWKTVTSKEAETLAPLNDAENLVKRRMVDYQFEQERIQQAAQARLQAEADAAAERERIRLEKQADKLKTPELREARLAEAAQVTAPAVHVESEVPRVAGQHTTTRWRAEVTDSKALMLAMLKDWPDWRAYVSLNQGELDRLAARTKGCIKGIPGIEFK